MVIIYKTVNQANGKMYVGKDGSNDPNYLGSLKGRASFALFPLNDAGQSMLLQIRKSNHLRNKES